MKRCGRITGLFLFWGTFLCILDHYPVFLSLYYHTTLNLRIVIVNVKLEDVACLVVDVTSYKHSHHYLSSLTAPGVAR